MQNANNQYVTDVTLTFSKRVCFLYINRIFVCNNKNVKSFGLFLKICVTSITS